MIKKLHDFSKSYSPEWSFFHVPCSFWFTLLFPEVHPEVVCTLIRSSRICILTQFLLFRSADGQRVSREAEIESPKPAAVENKNNDKGVFVPQAVRKPEQQKQEDGDKKENGKKPQTDQHVETVEKSQEKIESSRIKVESSEIKDERSQIQGNSEIKEKN